MSSFIQTCVNNERILAIVACRTDFNLKDRPEPIRVSAALAPSDVGRKETSGDAAPERGVAQACASLVAAQK
jgi:hypothetical protein